MFDAAAANPDSLGIGLGLGGVTVLLRTDRPEMTSWLTSTYGWHPQIDPRGTVTDLQVSVLSSGAWRRFVRPQATFRFDGISPFRPLPADRAPALFEWGLNWAIAQRANWYLMVHAAVVAKAGRAVILPGQPGSGKSTLAAALLDHGWRLLSDEFALISLTDGRVHPLWRPISLKGNALTWFRREHPARMSLRTYPSDKGPVGFYVPDRTSVAGGTATPAAIVIPRYDPTHAFSTEAVSGFEVFAHMIRNSFNYARLGERGFATLAETVRGCRARAVVYPDVAPAIASIETLVSAGAEPV